jgi:hypothetical protein
VADIAAEAGVAEGLVEVEAEALEGLAVDQPAAAEPAAAGEAAISRRDHE